MQAYILYRNIFPIGNMKCRPTRFTINEKYFLIRHNKSLAFNFEEFHRVLMSWLNFFPFIPVLFPCRHKTWRCLQSCHSDRPLFVFVSRSSSVREKNKVNASKFLKNKIVLLRFLKNSQDSMDYRVHRCGYF